VWLVSTSSTVVYCTTTQCVYIDIYRGGNLWLVSTSSTVVYCTKQCVYIDIYRGGSLSLVSTSSTVVYCTITQCVYIDLSHTYSVYRECDKAYLYHTGVWHSISGPNYFWHSPHLDSLAFTNAWNTTYTIYLFFNLHVRIIF
jgi:hypothetical protein